MKLEALNSQNRNWLDRQEQLRQINGSDLEFEQLQREIRSEERKQSPEKCISEERPEATVNEDREKDTGEQRHEALTEFNEEENQIMEKLVEELSKESIEQPPNLQGIDK